MTQRQRQGDEGQRQGDEGYLLIGLVVICFLIALALTVAAPKVARSLERDREVESVHRAQQYVRAIQLYYRKVGHYPTSVDQLENTNNMRFLRQRYTDPLTGGEFRLIPFGQAKTQVKGFFGEPLQGAAPGSLGTLQGQASGFGSTQAGTGGIGSPQGAGAGPGIGGAGIGAPAPGGPGIGAAPGAGSGFGTAPTSTDAGSVQGSAGPFVGVGSNAKGPALVEWNGSANKEDWEFLYDPRVELLRAKVSILGGAAAVNPQNPLGGNTSSFPGGQANPPGTGPGGAGAPTQPGSPAPAPGDGQQPAPNAPNLPAPQP